MRRNVALFILLGFLTVGVGVFFTVQVVQSNSPEKQIALAQEALKNGEYEKSAKLFEKIVDDHPSNTGARTGLASAYMGLGEFDLAIETLEEGIVLKPKEPQFYYFLSSAHEGRNDLPQVIEALDRGIEATGNTAIEELKDQLETNLQIVIDRRYIQEGHSRSMHLEWIKSNGAITPVEAEWEVENNAYGTIEDITETITSFQAENTGEVEITSTVGSITKKEVLYIEDQVIEEMTVTPEDIGPLVIGQSVDLSVIRGIDADGMEMELSPEWHVDDEEIAALSSTDGLEVNVEALSEGVTSIIASYQELEHEIDFIVEGDNKFIQARVQGEGSISISPDEMSYPEGTEITLKATPYVGYQFVRWEGDVNDTANPLTVTLDSSMSVVAVFEPVGHALNLTITGEGQIIRDSLNTHYEKGSIVSLYAQPKSGWTFSHWNGGVHSNSDRIQVLMDGDKNISAVFESIDRSSSSSSDRSTGVNESNTNRNSSTTKENTSGSSTNQPKDSTEDKKPDTNKPKEQDKKEPVKQEPKPKPDIVEPEVPQPKPGDKEEAPIEKPEDKEPTEDPPEDNDDTNPNESE